MRKLTIFLLAVMPLMLSIVACDSNAEKPIKGITVDVPVAVPDQVINLDMTHFSSQKKASLRATEHVLWEGIVEADFASAVSSLKEVKGMKITEIKIKVAEPTDFPIGFLSELRVYIGSSYQLIAKGVSESINSTEMKVAIVSNDLEGEILSLQGKLPIRISTTQATALSEIADGKFANLETLKLLLQTKLALKVEVSK